MKPEEARFILAAARPFSGSPNAPSATSEDPNIAEAFRVMNSDVELKLWYEEHCRFDQAVADRVSCIEPPSDLELNIRVGLKVSGLIPWWQRGTFRALAIAASIMLMAAASRVTLHSPPSSSGTESVIVAEPTNNFRRSIVSDIRNLKKLDHTSDQVSQLVAWLNQHGAPILANLNLLSHIGDVEVVGCKLLEWNGHRVSLMCFPAPDADGKTHSFHLIVVDEQALPDIAGDRPSFASEDGWSTALWRQGSKVVMLATDNPDPTELRAHCQQIPLT